MARRSGSEDLATTVTLLRALRGWSKKQLADASGIDKSRISRYELGKETPSPRTLERLAATTGLPTFLLEPMRCFIHRMRESTTGGRTSIAVPTGSPTPGEESKQVLGEALDRTVCQARAELKLHAERTSRNPAPPLDPEILWEQLRLFADADRRLLVRNAREYQDPLFCERLCVESLRAAAANPLQARELAELARLVAEHVSGPPAWCLRLQGYAWAFVANAHRAAGDLPAAEIALARAGKLWQEGGAEPDLADETQHPDLDAAMRQLRLAVEPPR